MKRIATTILTLSAFAFFCQTTTAADATLESVNARVTAIESRLEAIEKALTANTGSYTYQQEQATLEATNAGQQQTSAPKPSGTYLIQDGDTLGSIARKHNVERAELLEANRLSEGQPIYIGETLVIPGTEAPEPPTQEVVKNHTQPAPAKEKTVVIGETKKEAPAKSHTVVKGDTLTNIAARYSTDVKSLKAANGLRTDTISLGQKLALPGAPVKVAADTTKQPEPSGSQKAEFEYENELLKNDETYGYYNVKKGDNLYALARDFFSSMAELQRLNRLGDSTLIYPGDELIVPTSKYNAYHSKGEMVKR
jgi:LysM repeat protein